MTDINLSVRMSHRNCTVILPGSSYPNAKEQWRRERTHGCWCSSWRLDQGEYKIWKNDQWETPSKGELRKSPVIESKN